MRFLPGLLALCGLCLCSLGSFAAPIPVSAAAPATTSQPTASQPATDESHEHGVGRLAIRVEGDLLALRLRVPLQAMLGREAPPRTARQRQAVRQMAATLHDPQSLYVPAAAAGCTAGPVTLRSDAIDARLLAAESAESATPAATAAAAAHADLHVDVGFRCASPQALNGLQIRLFEAFPALRQVDATIITPRGDSGARLTPNRTSLTW